MRIGDRGFGGDGIGSFWVGVASAESVVRSIVTTSRVIAVIGVSGITIVESASVVGVGIVASVESGTGDDTVGFVGGSADSVESTVVDGESSRSGSVGSADSVDSSGSMGSVDSVVVGSIGSIDGGGTSRAKGEVAVSASSLPPAAWAVASDAGDRGGPGGDGAFAGGVVTREGGVWTRTTLPFFSTSSTTGCAWGLTAAGGSFSWFSLPRSLSPASSASKSRAHVTSLTTSPASSSTSSRKDTQKRPRPLSSVVHDPQSHSPSLPRTHR
jgi:hypothetical protein